MNFVKFILIKEKHHLYNTITPFTEMSAFDLRTSSRITASLSTTGYRLQLTHKCTYKRSI